MLSYYKKKQTKKTFLEITEQISSKQETYYSYETRDYNKEHNDTYLRQAKKLLTLIELYAYQYIKMHLIQDKMSY